MNSRDGTPLQRYRALVASGALAADKAQAYAAEALSLLASRLARYRPSLGVEILSLITGKKRNEVPQGLYIYGAVGRGKTMLMDIFYSAVRYEPKRRIHFHAFMTEIHGRIAAARKTDKGDPIPIVAEEVATEAALLCLDELQVTDIADAMILGRLFQQLYERNVVTVATSNSAPRQLYRHGLNRPLFEPFIALIEQRMEVLELESVRDYRLSRLQDTELYFTPLDDEAEAGMDRAFATLTKGAEPEPSELRVAGRKIPVPAAAMGVARFSFAALCDKPLGAADYAAIAEAFHTVLIDGIPVMRPADRNQARRFIALIDVLYDNGTGLVASAAAEPDALYVAGDAVSMFARTASRLMEMRSEDYLTSRHARADAPPEGQLADTELSG